jgi:hypothetical protein
MKIYVVTQVTEIDGAFSNMLHKCTSASKEMAGFVPVI